ncbi:MAG: class I SAM-dependent methyltransferase [Hyphomonadaceae bacterium]
MTQTQTQKEYWSGKVGGEWAAHADRIDRMLAPMTEAALARAAIQPGERVLDIGCGAGATSFAIARGGARVTGVDLSPPLLAVARARAQEGGHDVAFVEDDAGAAQFPERFDAAFSRFGIMFFEQPAAALAHLRTLLRADGRFVFICWRRLPENEWATAPIEAVRLMLTAPLAAPDPNAPGPFAFAEADKVRRLLGEAGWRDVALTRWDGDILVGGGGSLEESAEFLLRIGPCARAIADQGLDAEEARRRVMEHLAPRASAQGVALAAACWVVEARA